ncbi:hypothetical protein HY389_01670 [Candidatus Daviesbacteria bacterium]|nr:hypothetical protein [Candidatus Daviesbacteria bacterium]
MSWVNFNLSKREKIIIASVVLSLGLVSSTQYVPFYLTQRYIIGLAAASFVLSLWALWEGITKTKALILLILPTLFTLALASFYFLLPVRWLTRIPVAVVFGLAFYSLLLSQNVFNVASIRTIPLYRAASTVTFLFTLITAYLLFNVVFSFEMIFFQNGVVVALLSFPLILQVLWSIEMESISVLVLVYSAALSLVMGEVAVAISLWPISPTVASMVLATTLYMTTGITTHALKDRLSRTIVWEYVGVGGVVMLVALLSTSWVG